MDPKRFMRALEDIEEIKKKRMDKIEEQEYKSEYQKIKDDRTKEALKKQLEKRRIELGVEARSN